PSKQGTRCTVYLGRGRLHDLAGQGADEEQLLVAVRGAQPRHLAVERCEPPSIRAHLGTPLHDQARLFAVPGFAVRIREMEYATTSIGAVSALVGVGPENATGEPLQGGRHYTFLRLGSGNPNGI